VTVMYTKYMAQSDLAICDQCLVNGYLVSLSVRASNLYTKRQQRKASQVFLLMFADSDIRFDKCTMMLC
jgi:hypothetical protein